MANALGQHNSGNPEMEMTFPAKTMLDRESAASTPWILADDRFSRSVDTSTNSAELLHRLSELVDGFVRLSRPCPSVPANTENSEGWSIFECAHAMLSVAGAHGNIQFQHSTEGVSTCFPKG